MHRIFSTLVVATSLLAGFIEPVRSHHSSAYIGGHNGFFSSFGKSHHLPHIVPVRKTISLPKHVPVLKHVSLPLPYPVFRPEQIPMYKAVPVKMEKIVRVPIKVPKYYSVPYHKVIAIPRYVEVPVEVPIYQEVFVKRVVEVPVPVYIKRPAKQSDVPHSTGGGYHQPILKDQTEVRGHGAHGQTVDRDHLSHDPHTHAVPDGQHGQIHVQEVRHGQDPHGAQHDQGVQHGQVVEEAQHVNAGHEADRLQELHPNRPAQANTALTEGQGIYDQPGDSQHQHSTAETEEHQLQQAQEVLQAQATQKAFHAAPGPYLNHQGAQSLPQAVSVQRVLHAQQVQGLLQMHPLRFRHFQQAIQS